MVTVKRVLLAVTAAAAVAVLPMAPAMANGHGFRAGHGFGAGHGLLGAAVALATLPLAVASSVVAGVSESIAPYAGQGYAAPYARPYYAPYAGYYYSAPRVGYGPRPYYGGRPGYDARRYYHAGGQPYPRR